MMMWLRSRTVRSIDEFGVKCKQMGIRVVLIDGNVLGHDGDPSRRVVITGALIPIVRRLCIEIRQTAVRSGVAGRAAFVDHVGRLSGGSTMGLKVQQVERFVGCEAFWLVGVIRIIMNKWPIVAVVGLL